MIRKIVMVRSLVMLLSLATFSCPLLITQSASGQESRAEKFAKLKELMKYRKGESADAQKNDKIIVTLQDWTDSKRKRTIPVKIYQPKTSGPYPVIIFSHGLGGSRDSATYFGEAMAENGYLCVALQHPGSDTSVWMNSLKNGNGTSKQIVMNEMRQAANGENLRLRVEDVKYALDQLEQMNTDAGAWHNKIDLTKVACSGHSFGAGTTMAIAGQTYGMSGQKITATDPRIKAALYMSPPVNLRGRDPKSVYAAIKVPGMLMTGTEDNSPINDNSAADRLVPFKNISAPDQYLVVFAGGDHMIFGGRAMRGNPNRDASKDERFHVLINKLSLAFFDAYLKEDDKQKQWLQRSAAEYLGKQAEFKAK